MNAQDIIDKNKDKELLWTIVDPFDDTELFDLNFATYKQVQEYIFDYGFELIEENQADIDIDLEVVLFYYNEQEEIVRLYSEVITVEAWQAVPQREQDIKDNSTY